MAGRRNVIGWIGYSAAPAATTDAAAAPALSLEEQIMELDRQVEAVSLTPQQEENLVSEVAKTIITAAHTRETMARQLADEILEKARREAAELTSTAAADAAAKSEQAAREATQLVASARAEADRTVAEAQAQLAAARSTASGMLEVMDRTIQAQMGQLGKLRDAVSGGSAADIVSNS